MPRPPEDPTPDQVLAVMEPGEPYSARELVEVIGDTSKPTVHRRLQTLVDQGEVNKKLLGGTAVYWVDPE